MAFGLFTSPRTPYTSLMCLLLLLVMVLFHVDARPKNGDSATDHVDLSEEWKEAADWIASSDGTPDDDSWRAFPRGIVKNNSRWWEGILDDNLWNADSYRDDDGFDNEDDVADYVREKESQDGAESNYKDNAPSVGEDELFEEQGSPIIGEDNDDDDDDKKGEMSESSPIGVNNDDDDDDEDVNDDDDNKDVDNAKTTFVPKGGLNSFVDQKPSSYFGDDFAKKTWSDGSVIDKADADENDEVDDEKDDDDDNENLDLMDNVKEGGDPTSSAQVNDEISDEVQILKKPAAVEVPDADNGDEKDGDDEEVDINAPDLRSEVEMLDGVDDDVGADVDEGVDDKDSNDIGESVEDVSNSKDLKDDIDFVVPLKNKRGGIDTDTAAASRAGKDVASSNDDIFVKPDKLKIDIEGEKLGDKLDVSDGDLQNWNQPEMADKKKGTDGEEFEDWADWDDSAFEDYDRNDDGSDDDVKKSGESEEKDGKKDIKVKVDKTTDQNKDDDGDDDDDWSYEESDEESSEDEDSNDDEYDSDEDDDEEDDDDDDDYDFDDDSDDDDDEEEDEDESEEDDDDDENESDYYNDDEEEDDDADNDNGINYTGMTKSNLLSETISGQTARRSAAPAQQAVKDEDIESLDQTNADEDHYNKGIIYDSSHPFKKEKPSVKKDLNGPKHTEGQDAVAEKSGEKLPEASSAKKPSNTDVAVEADEPEGKMSTGLESLTSPNPAPTVTTWTDTSMPSLAPSPSSLPSPSPSSSSSSPWPAADDLMFGDQPHDDEDDDDDGDNGGYVNSYPLELCRVDYECRSGRSCVQGICKCFTAQFCAGHYKPVCGSDGVQYPSHCELHRTSCLNRIRIRVDRSGRCFRKEIVRKEKSWLMEQERLLQEKDEDLKVTEQHKNSVDIPRDQIEEFSDNISNGPSSTTPLDQTVLKKNELSSTDKKKEENECNWNEMAKFKEDLLMYHCHKFIEPNCKLEVKTDRLYLSMLVFSYYDRNFDFFLTADELRDKERDEHFTDYIVKSCHLEDFVRFADTDQKDGKLTVSEFKQSYVMPRPSSVLPNNLEVVSTLASAGDGLELKCGVQASKVVWKRFGVTLEDDQKNHKLMVFDDGALFFSKLSLHHIGNYTCIDAADEKNAQVHRLNIQTSPILEMSQTSRNNIAGTDVDFRCHAEGVPKPTVTWRHNGKDVHNSRHVSVYYGHEHIVVHNVQPGKDSGEYTCRAHSQAGTTEQSVSINVHAVNDYLSFDMFRNEGTFLVFHDNGITAYDPMTCLVRHNVKGDFGKFKFIPDVIESPMSLCKRNKSCQWGDAVKVGREFVYVSQPDQNRVLIAEAGNFWNPIQVIDTDHHPEKLQYVPHLDQVWVLCHSQSGKDSAKTIVVIRDASQHIQHRSVHTRPVGNHFDTVEDLFIAPSNDLRHEFDHGYVTHTGKAALSKINLEDMSYTEAIDLSVYGCTPVSVAFVPLGGHVVIQCVSKTDQNSLQLVMDYLTSAIVSTTSISGRPLVSPDSRHMITVDEYSGKVVVASISIEGLMETTYEVTVSASISDVSFIPSTYHHGYDLILTSADDDDLIVMNLVTGKVEKMSGSNLLESSQTWHPSSVRRRIVAGDPMSRFVMTPSKSSLDIINFVFKQVECEFTDLVGGKVMVYVSSPRITS